jgi:hypothetical protein
MLRHSCRAGNMVLAVAPALPLVSRYASRADEPRVKDNGSNCAQSSSKPFVDVCAAMREAWVSSP